MAKVAVITGGASELAKRLLKVSENGCRCLLVDIDAERLATV